MTLPQPDAAPADAESLLRVKRRDTRGEDILSDLPPMADIAIRAHVAA
jgi:hypothetical protein